MRILARNNRRALPLLAALTAATLITLLVGPAFADGNDPFPKVASFAFKFGTETPQPEAIDAGLRILVAPYESGMFLVDADTMKPVRNVPFGFTAGHRLSVDPIRHLLFIPHEQNQIRAAVPRDAAGIQRAIASLSPPIFSIYDLAANKMLGSYTFPDAYRGETIDATGYFAPKDKLYVITDLLEAGDQPLHRLTVHQIDRAKILGDAAHAVDWSYDFDGCFNVADGGGRYGFVNRSTRGDFLYFPCDTGQQGPSNGVVRLDIPAGDTPSDTSKFTPEYEFFGGGLGDGFVVADPAGDRIAIFAGGASKQKLYVFDVYRRAWTGSVPLPEGTIGGSAFNPSTGRLYATVVDGGAVVTEGAWLPTPQGATYPTDPSVRIGNPVFDPVRKRLFMTALRSLSSTETLQDKIVVYEDRIPYETVAAPQNPDERTENLPEVAGRTLSTFSGGGSSYGMRYLFTGGTQVKGQGQVFAVEKNASDGFATLTTAAGQGRNLPFAPAGSGREVYFGRVANLFVDSGTAAAKALSSDPDAGTRADIAQIRDAFAAGQTIQGRDGEGAQEQELKRQVNKSVDDAKAGARPSTQSAIDWPYPEANCADFGNQGDKASDARKGAKTTCDHETPGAKAEATSLSELAGLSVRVGYATSSVDAHRDPKLGMVVTSTALARNIEVLGALSIGEVRTTAVVRAFGRPGSARSTFTRELRQVVLRDSSGDEVYRCGFGDTACDPLTVSKMTTKYYPTHLRVDVPSPEADPKFAQTPGGAQALATKSIFQFWSDFNSNGESSYEVPGLQIMVYDDAYPQILQLAGVAADAHYTVTGGGGGGGEDTGGGGGQTIYVTNQTNYPPPAAPTQVLGTKQGPFYVTLQRAASGVAFAMTRPREAAMLASVWLLAGAPVYLALRRRSLAAIKEE